MQRSPVAVGVACLVAVLLTSGMAFADTVALVTASPASDEAARYLSSQLDLPVVRRGTSNARHLGALVAEARAGWRQDLVVVIDAERAVVSVLRPRDGTMGSRALAPTAAGAPYVVALAAVELLELVRNAPPAQAAALPEPSPPALMTRPALEIGLVQSVGTNGHIGLLQPTLGADLEVSRHHSPVWVAFGVHGTGLLPMNRDQVLFLRTEQRGRIEYARNELSLRVSAGHRQGLAAAVGWCDLGIAGVRVQAWDSTGSLLVVDQRTSFWLGLGGELRYTLGAGFSLGIGAGLAWFPVTSRYYASPPNAQTAMLAFDESAVEFRARASLIWEVPE